MQLISQTVIGGAESFGFELADNLSRRGHEVLLLANRKNGPLFEREHSGSLETRSLDRKSRLDPRILPFLLGAVRSFRPDVLHGHNFGANSWVRFLGVLHPRLPVVCHEHSGRKPGQPRSRNRLDQILYRRCAAVLAVSQEIEGYLLTKIGVSDAILHQVPNGIDVERYARSPTVRPNPLDVICVASLTPVKNHEVLLRAWRMVASKHPGARLTLVGDGPLRERLLALAREGGVSDSVVFAGLQRDVRPFLWRSSVFVLPSQHEGLPLALLEAMAAGLACVASRVGEIPSALGDAGRLVNPGDDRALATTLLALLDSPEDCERIGRDVAVTAETRFSMRACVDRIEQIYQEITARRRF